MREAERRAGPYPYYGASGVADYVDNYLFDGEYLLIAEDGENLRTRNTPVAFLARGKFWVNNHAHIVRANSQADTRFLMYADPLDRAIWHNEEESRTLAVLRDTLLPKLVSGELRVKDAERFLADAV